jgi:hypothetical protein
MTLSRASKFIDEYNSNIFYIDDVIDRYKHFKFERYDNISDRFQYVDKILRDAVNTLEVLTNDMIRFKLLKFDFDDAVKNLNKNNDLYLIMNETYTTALNYVDSLLDKTKIAGDWLSAFIAETKDLYDYLADEIWDMECNKEKSQKIL